MFGCVCYAHIAKDERKKLGVVARRCVLIGYGTEVKGYRLYDPDREKAFFIWDVKFNESEVGLKKESSVVEPPSYVELEFSADGVDSDANGISDDADELPIARCQ